MKQKIVEAALLWNNFLPHFEIFFTNSLINKIEISMLFTDNIAVTWRFGKPISQV